MDVSLQGLQNQAVGWLANVSSQVHDSLQRIQHDSGPIVVEEPGQPKRCRDEAGSRAAGSSGGNPFTPQQSQWMSGALNASIGTFGERCDQRFQQGEARITVLEAKQ